MYYKAYHINGNKVSLTFKSLISNPKYTLRASFSTQGKSTYTLLFPYSACGIVLGYVALIDVESLIFPLGSLLQASCISSSNVPFTHEYKIVKMHFEKRA